MLFWFCRCDISLQNTHIGEAKAMSKNNARNLAAASALFKLYETQDVIKVWSVQNFMKKNIVRFITPKIIFTIPFIISFIIFRWQGEMTANFGLPTATFKENLTV